MTKICAWCGTVLGGEGPEISHGICEACAALVERESGLKPSRSTIRWAVRVLADSRPYEDRRKRQLARLVLGMEETP